MKARAKFGITLVAIMLLSSLSPLMTVAAPGDGSTDGEDRQGDGPLEAEDAMVQYAILTSFSFLDEFERLAEWKTEKGYYAKVYSTDWVSNHYPGDTMAQYHAWLEDLYNHTGGGLEYLLIGADDEIVRSREIWTGIKSGWEPYSGSWVYSDHYYAGLSHDWDLDNDGKYGELGETDWDAEIAVGRAPVSSTQEATDVVDKLLAYEMDPEVGDWMRTAVLVSSVMNPPNANDTNAHRPSDIYKSWEDNAYESLERTFPLIPSNMDQHVLYDYNQIEGGNYTPENDTLDRQSYIAALNMGSSIFVSVTHGWIPTGNGIPHYVGDGIGFNWSSAFYWTNISGLQNGNKTPFIYFSSCYVGNFSELNDTNFERLLTMRDGGAIGFIAPSENTYRGEENPESSDGNWWMSENFWRHLIDDDQRPGDAFYDMIREYEPHLRDVGANPDSPYFRQNHAAYNLIGDPEMPIWLDMPRNLELRLPPSIYDLEYDLPVRVMDGAIPVEGARVCLAGEDFYAYAMTDSDGWAQVHIDPLSEGQSVTVTATKPQYLPLQTIVGIAPAPAELTVIPHTIRASTDVPRAGAPTDLGAEVRNVGHGNAVSFSVRFYDGDPDAGGVQVGADVDVPGLPGETSATVSVTWDAPTAGWHDIYVMVDSSDVIEEVLEGNNLKDARVFVSAYNAEAGPMEVEGGEGSTALAINKEAVIAVTVTSTGSAALSPLSVRLYLGDPGAGGVPIGGDRSIASVPAGSSRVVTFPFTPPNLGTFKLVAVVDPLDEYKEFNELDNEAEIWITVGHPPFWKDILDVNMVEDSDKVLDLTPYITDYDNETSELSVSIRSISTNHATVTLLGKVVTIVPEEDWSGSFEVEVMVTDGDFSVSATFDVEVTPRNDAPRFRNTGYLVNVTEGDRFYYVFDAFDPDGDTVTFTDNSELFDITADGIIDFTPNFEDIGYSPIHVFRVIASDGTAQTYYPMTLEFETVNTAPVLDLPENLTLKVGAPFSYTVLASDREGDSLTFSAETSLFVIISGTGQIMFTPTASMLGEHNVTVTVNDGALVTEGSVMIYIYEEPGEDRSTESVSYAVLAGEVALVVVGLLFIINFRRRSRKEEALRQEQEKA